MLSLERISRRFGAIQAVVDASLTIERTKITAIIGENGAGKSTLLKIGAGTLSPSAGTVRADGAIGMVHQHFMLVGTFTALENIVLGAEPVRSLGRLDMARARRDAEAMMKRTGLTVPLDEPTDALTVGQRQRLEILRVLVRGADVLLLDEPTAVLSPLEADELYGVLGKLAAEGRAIAVVTHRLDEVVRFANAVFVMRRGRIVHTEDGSRALDEDTLTRAIMGAEPPVLPAAAAVADDATLGLEARGLRLVVDGKTLLDGLDLGVRRGEILGLAGIEGNGQRELVRVLAGLERRATGVVRIEGRDVSALDVVGRRSVLATVFEDRHEEGLVLSATVGDNLVLGELGTRGFDEAATIARRIARFGVLPPRRELPVSSLSGGNQQKVVIARAFDRLGAGRAMVLSQPTRGVDVGAAATIHEAILEAAAAGSAILLSSADLGELKRLSHRIAVVHKGRVVAEHPPSATEQEIGRAMLGLEAA